MGITVNIEIAILSSVAGHRVVVTADGHEIHSTINYPDLDFAKLHAREIEGRAGELLMLRSSVGER